MSNPFDEGPRDYGSVSGQGAGFKPRRGKPVLYYRCQCVRVVSFVLDEDFPRLKQRVSDACYEISRQSEWMMDVYRSVKISAFFSKSTSSTVETNRYNI